MSESNASLAAEDLFAWNDANANIWRSLATERPEMLNVPLRHLQGEDNR